MKRFQIGEHYDRSGLFGGHYTDTVISRTDDTVTFEETWVAEDSGELCSCTVSRDVEIDSYADSERVITWSYDSDGCGQVAHGYLYAGSDEPEPEQKETLFLLPEDAWEYAFPDQVRRCLTFDELQDCAMRMFDDHGEIWFESLAEIATPEEIELYGTDNAQPGDAQPVNVEYIDGSEGWMDPKCCVFYEGQVFPDDSPEHNTQHYDSTEQLSAWRLVRYCEQHNIPVWLTDTEYDVTYHLGDWN